MTIKSAHGSATIIYDLRLTNSLKLKIHLVSGMVTGINGNGRLSELLSAYYGKGFSYVTEAFGSALLRVCGATLV